MEPGGYYSTMLNSKDKQRLRYGMVKRALEGTITESAEYYRATRVTVRKWVERYRAEGWEGLKDESRAPKSCPHKSSREVERKVLKLREEVPWGPERIREQWGEKALPCGIGAFKRIIRTHGKQRPKRKKKSRRKADLRAAKAGLAPLQEYRMDTKYLTDLAGYVPQMEALGLPRFQYTIREVPTGAMWLSYSQELSMDHATRVARRFLMHLGACGVALAEVTLQTDWGSEFDGACRDPKANGFVRTIESFGARHRAAPPHCPNANADVETVHQIIEEEFFDHERFESRSDFLRKVTTCQHWFNLCRKNRSKGWKTPMELLRAKAPHTGQAALLLSPILIEDWPQSLIPDLPRSRQDAITWVDTMYPSLTDSRRLPFEPGGLGVDSNRWIGLSRYRAGNPFPPH